ncbi:MAG: DbpA RNA binding domain-containing protein [bacterium]
MICKEQVDGGKKQKLRPGDIVGALTRKDSHGKIPGYHVEKIQVLDIKSYVAIQRNPTDVALKKINLGKLKGRNFKARVLASI